MSNMLTSQTDFFESEAVRRELVGVGDFESARVQTIIVAGRQKSSSQPSTFVKLSASVESIKESTYEPISNLS